MILARRSFLIGAASALAAPAIVRASSLMPVKALPVGGFTLAEMMKVSDAAFRLWHQRARDTHYLYELSGVEENGGILPPPPGVTINRSTNTWWRNG